MSNSKNEEITDILTSEGIKSGEFKKGQLLKFDSGIALIITKVDKKNGRAWARPAILAKEEIVNTHSGHDVTGGGEGDYPYCNDCKVNINEPSTEDGDKKALDRQDEEDRLQSA